MHQFFVEPQQITEEKVTIVGSDVNHICNVLRLQVGETVKISDGVSKKYLCEVKTLDSRLVTLSIAKELPMEAELPNKVYLFQGLPKADKMEWIIQKAVELGVYQIIPVSMKHCVVKLDEKKADKKIARWQKIAESAAKQSKRDRIPNVKSAMSYKDAIAFAKELDVCLVPYENAKGMEDTRNWIGQITAGQSVGIFIGPEGGFAPEEVELATKAGAKIITLGRRILRTETAGMFTLSILGYQLEQ